MVEHIHTVVIGAGQAGLAASRCLRERGVPHLVLEQERIGASWHRRWDSFTLVTPNSMLKLPEFEFGGDPEGFMQRDDVIGYLEAYAASFAAPLRLGVRVHELAPRTGGWVVHTSTHTIECEHVIVATGTYQKPQVPACAVAVTRTVTQLHSSQFRNADQLPEGAVLVVGTGQSGAQIADDLHGAGRRVYLSVSSAGRAPRTYRGRDLTEWLRDIGFFERPVESLKSPAERFAAHPHYSGRDGGKTLDLREFAARGITLLGRVAWADGDRIELTGNLSESIAAAERFAEEICALIDEKIDAAGSAAPAEVRRPPALSLAEPPTQLSLRGEGIGSIIWATGYSYDFSWTGAPLDAWGYPVTQQGVTSMFGLYFVGLHWLHRFKSGLLYGVGDDARHVAGVIARGRSTAPLNA